MTQRIDELDDLVGGHLRGKLDGQCGRAAGAFARHHRRRRILRFTVTTAAAAAIALGVLVAWERIASPAKQPDAPRQVASLPSIPAPEAVEPVIHQASWSRFVDQGWQMIDDRPVRQLRRRVVEEIEWYDARSQATVRTTVPREQILLIGVRTD